MTKVGEFVIKGPAYEDIKSILVNNGYAIEVFIPAQKGKSYTAWEYIMKVYKEHEGGE